MYREDEEIDLTTIHLSEVLNGVLGHVPTTATRLTRALVEREAAPFLETHKTLKKLISLVLGRGTFYARVNDGSRNGSIVRVGGKEFKVAQPGKVYYSQELEAMRSHCGLTVRLVHDQYLARKIGGSSGTTNVLAFHVDDVVIPNVGYTGRISAHYDDRKTVSLSSAEQASLEYLPNYKGPTVYKFSRTERTPEERAQLKSNYCFAPVDRFGHTVALGDMVIYAQADELTFGKLTRVTIGGTLAIKDMISGHVTRVNNNRAALAVREGNPVKGLMRFEKGDVLTDRLMMEKLKRA